MKIAIPITDNLLCHHFGHCAQFALVDIDETTKKITSRKDIPAPSHEPGALPVWLAEQGVNLVIAGGIGARAVELLKQNKIESVIGADVLSPEKLVTSYLEGALQQGKNSCDH
ncbi:MAG TPA: ATPase [Rhodospirillaceae bacterium]|nr:ATPase [Rhodospirillaceae bacterium]